MCAPTMLAGYILLTLAAGGARCCALGRNSGIFHWARSFEYMGYARARARDVCVCVCGLSVRAQNKYTFIRTKGIMDGYMCEPGERRSNERKYNLSDVLDTHWQS